MLEFATRRGGQTTRQLVEEQCQTWELRARRMGFNVGQLSLPDWFELLEEDADQHASDTDRALHGDVLAAVRAVISYRAMAITADWLEVRSDRAVVRRACATSSKVIERAVGEIASSKDASDVRVRAWQEINDTWRWAATAAASRDTTTDASRSDGPDIRRADAVAKEEHK